MRKPRDGKRNAMLRSASTGNLHVNVEPRNRVREDSGSNPGANLTSRIGSVRMAVPNLLSVKKVGRLITLSLQSVDHAYKSPGLRRAAAHYRYVTFAVLHSVALQKRTKISSSQSSV